MDKGKKKVKFTRSLSSTKPFWAFTKLTPEDQQRFKPKGGTVYLFQSKRNDEEEDWRADGYRWRQNGNGKFQLDGSTGICVYFKLEIGLDPKTKMKIFSKSFKRTIYYHPTIPGLVLIEYIGDEKVAVDFCHGNSTTQQKKDAPFYPTAKSTQKAMKNTEIPPKKLYRQLVNSASSDLGRHRTNAPRDQKQVRNAQQNLRAEKRLTQDSLYNLLAETSETGFIKRLMVHEDLMMFCYNENLLEKFKAVIDREDLPPQCISYDTTYKLGDFYVSFLVFRETEFIEMPCIPAIYLIHERRLDETHDFFFQYLVKFVPELKNARKLYLVTDHETAIINAIKKNLPEIDLFRCSIHAIKDVKRKLQSLQIPKEDRKRIKKEVKELFMQPTYVAYLTQLTEFQIDWPSQFSTYFLKNIHVDIDKLGFWACQRYGRTEITTNQSESLNAVLKRVNEWKEATIDVMAQSLFELSTFYNREIMRGRYLRTGILGYTLREDLIHKYDIDLDKPHLPQEGVIVDEIVTTIKNAYLRRDEFLEKKSLERTTQSSAAITSYTADHRLTIFARAMDVIEKKKVSFDVESGNFIVRGHLRNYLVQLFPQRDCTCAAGKTGHCYHVLACETLIGIKNEKSKKPNSTIFRKRSRSLPDKKSGNKKPRPLDLDVGGYPTKISEEIEFDRVEKSCLSSPCHPISPSFKIPQDKRTNESIDSEEFSFLDEDDSSEEGRERKMKKEESRMKKMESKIERYIPCELDEKVEWSTKKTSNPVKASPGLLDKEFSPADKNFEKPFPSESLNFSCDLDEMTEFSTKKTSTPVRASPGLFKGEFSLAVENFENPLPSSESLNVSFLVFSKETESSPVGSPESDPNHSDITLKATSVAEPTERDSSPKNTLTGNESDNSDQDTDNSISSSLRSRMKSDKQRLALDVTFYSSSEEEESLAVPEENCDASKHNYIYQDRFYSEEDISRLKRENWLSDRDMGAATTLMRHQFPDVGGLFDTLNGEFKQQFPASQKSKWIQILYDGINHWLVAGYGFPCMPEGTICIYDSKVKDGIPNPLVVSCCASILKTQKETIRILTTSVQQQNQDDCGWYAIAFATTLLHGHDPRKFCYEPKKFCNHFKKCLRERKLTSFPFCSASRSPTLRNEETSVIPVCCSCRRPEKLQNDSSAINWTAQCDVCQEWFHEECQDIPVEAKQIDFPWICKSCK